jgi:hypothetical protein
MLSRLKFNPWSTPGRADGSTVTALQESAPDLAAGLGGAVSPFNSSEATFHAAPTLVLLGAIVEPAQGGPEARTLLPSHRLNPCPADHLPALGRWADTGRCPAVNGRAPTKP